ncbi:MAG: two-component regulator propeller domain-containing protein [Bacteroidota bacterium]
MIKNAVPKFVTGILFCCLSCFTYNHSFAQESFMFNHLEAEDGLLDNIVYEVFQDSKGYFWFGTIAGLQRYDGTHFINFTFNPEEPNKGIQENIIRCITEISDGSIWCGTQGGGVIRYKNGMLQPPLIHDPDNSNSIAGQIVESIVEGSDGTIWIGTDKGLSRYKNGTIISFKNDPLDESSLSENRIFSLHADQSDRLWVGTNNGLNLYLGNGQFQRILHDPTNPKSIANNFVHDITEDADGSLWLSIIEGGLNKLNTETLTAKRYLSDPKNPNAISSNVVLKSVIDQEGNVWSATWGGGLNKFDGKKFTTFRHDPNKSSISNNNIEDVTVDRNGNIWTANYFGGVNKYSAEKIVNYFASDYVDEGLIPMDNVLKVFVDKDTAIWIATNEGVSKYKNGDISNYGDGFENYLTSNRIDAIYGDRKGNMWFGPINDGLNLLAADGTFTHFSYDRNNPSGVHDPSITCMVEDLSSDILFGGRKNGLSKYSYETGKFETFRESNINKETTLADNRVNDMEIDSEGAVWIATGRGLSRFQNNEFRSFYQDNSNPKSLPNNSVLAVAVDGADNVWVGFSGGVAKMTDRAGNFKVYTEKDGLADAMIEELMTDSDGQVWVVTHNGASVYDASLDQFISFGEKDGFIDPNLIHGFASKHSREVYFISTIGFQKLSIDNLDIQKESDKLLFTDFSLTQNYSLKADSLIKLSLERNEAITLEYTQSSFKVNFAVLNGEVQSSLNYLYRLKNVTDDWTFIGEKNSLDFSYLEPGTYEIEVKTRGCESINCRAVLVVKIVPPWWQNLWLKVFAVAFILMVLFAIFRWRIGTLQRHKKILKEEVDHKNTEIGKAIELLKGNIDELLKSGSGLKNKSGLLTAEAKNQLTAAKTIESDIESILEHSLKNSENAFVSSQISQQTVEKLKDIEATVKSHVKNIKSISEKTAVLEDIFRQTNILALNASVEAARAGDFGNGFSVIANEIRKLAEKSELASKDIQHATETGVSETQRVSDLILKFVPEVEKSASLIEEITQSGNSQNESVANVDTSLKSLAENAGNNSHISQDIYGISLKLEELAKYLNEQVESLGIHYVSQQ